MLKNDNLAFFKRVLVSFSFIEQHTTHSAVKISMWINLCVFFINGCVQVFADAVMGTVVLFSAILLPPSRSSLLTRICSLQQLTTLLGFFLVHSYTTSSIILLFPPSTHYPLHQSLSHSIIPFFIISSLALRYNVSLLHHLHSRRLVLLRFAYFPKHLPNCQLLPYL